MAERYVLDTSAILSFTDQEEGAAQVERILKLANAGRCRVDTTLRAAGEDQATLLVGLIKAWPIHWVYPDEKTLLLAGRFKAFHRLSFADAQIAATARRSVATLVHKDPEFESLAGEIDLLSLPFKGRPRPDDLGEEEVAPSSEA